MKQKIKLCINSLKLKKRCKKNCKIGKSYCLNNVDCIDVANNVTIGNDFRIECYKKFRGESYNPRLIISADVKIGERFTGLVTDKIIIGKGTCIGDEVTITSENHGIDLTLNEPYAIQQLASKEVYIGENCIIGKGVTILPGVILGNNCVVMPNSVVTKSFESGDYVGGYLQLS